MYSATQLHYLQAMGIPAWQSRNSLEPAVSIAPSGVSINSSPDSLPEANLSLPDWLSTQPVQMNAAGQVPAAEPSESGLLVLSEALPQSDSSALVVQPFHGPHGQLLDAMLKSINLIRGRCTLAALADQAAAPPSSLPLGQFLDQAKPRLILFFCFPGGCDGRVDFSAADFSDGGQRRLMKIGPSPCIASYHPCHLLENPAHKRDAWEDLKRVRQLLGSG